MADGKSVYKIVFLNQGEVFEVYARQVTQGSLFGFVEVEELVFGERSQVVVDPTEERVKNEFRGVKRFHVPLHAVVRIDEVEREGVARVTAPREGAGTVAAFPGPLYPPRDLGKTGR